VSQNVAIEPVAAGPDPDSQQPRRLSERLSALAQLCRRWFDPTKRRALTALIIRVVGAAIAYGMQILLAQWMGLTEYGIFVGVWVWLLVLGGIAPLGFNVSIIGMASRYHDANDREHWRGVMAVSYAVTVASSLMFASMGWTLLYLFPNLVSEAHMLPVWLCLFCVPLIAIADVNDGIARAHGWMHTALVPIYLLRPILLIGGTCSAMLAGASVDATLVMAMAIMACLVTILAQGAVLLVRILRIDRGGKTSARPMTWFIASLPIVVAQTFELLTQNFDMMAVSYFLGPESTGIYFAALKTIALLSFVNFAIGAATANNVASLHGAGRREELEELLHSATNLTFWPTVLGAIVLVTLAPMLLMLFGKDFAGHAYLTAVLAVGFVAKSFVGPAELYLNVLGHQRICAIILLFAATLNMTLNIVLIPLLGLLGAAIATSASLVTLAIGLFVVSRKKLGIALMPSLPLRGVVEMVVPPRDKA